MRRWQYAYQYQCRDQPRLAIARYSEQPREQFVGQETARNQYGDRQPDPDRRHTDDMGGGQHDSCGKEHPETIENDLVHRVSVQDTIDGVEHQFTASLKNSAGKSAECVRRSRESTTAYSNLK